MVDITHKNNTLRKAVAEAIVLVSSQQTIDAIQQRKVPKGDVFEMAKTAGLFGVKRTSDMIPDCHPLPVEFTAVRYQVEGLKVKIEVEVHTIYKTGVEVEAMHGASVVALTMYDMLKPIDKGVEIEHIRLLSKSGGKSDYGKNAPQGLKAVVIVCSDLIYNEKKENKSGNYIVEQLRSFGVDEIAHETVPDEQQVISDKLMKYHQENYGLIIFSGGTGLSVRDVTPEAVRSLLDVEIEGIMEASRSYGQQRTPHAMFSRGIAGLRGQTLVLTLPGSSNGIKESMNALFPAIFNVYKIIGGRGK
jgi:cyclic pyranopterin monophosphate synthase